MNSTTIYDRPNPAERVGDTQPKPPPPPNALSVDASVRAAKLDEPAELVSRCRRSFDLAEQSRLEAERARILRPEHDGVRNQANEARRYAEDVAGDLRAAE